MPLRHYSEVLTRGESEVVVREFGVGLLWVSNEARLSWATKHLFCPDLQCLGHFEKVPRGEKGPKESHQTVLKASRAIGLCSFKVKDVY